MKDAEIIDADDELLVAYLDGELAREQRDGLENRLIDEESLRQRLQSLQRSWDLLDWLPSVPNSERAVQTTMQFIVADLTGLDTLPDRKKSNEETVTSTASSRDSAIHAPRPAPQARRFMAIAWLILPVLIGGSVFAWTRWTHLRVIRAQIADFPVAVDMDAYAIADNTELLEDLMSFNRFQGVVAGSATPEIDRLVSPDSSHSIYKLESPDALGAKRVVLPDHDQLTERLDDLPQSQRIAALSRWDRFNRLDESAKSKLRQTAARICSSENSAEILSALRQYVRFREQISNETAAKIESESGPARAAAIDEGIEEVISSIGRSTGRNLSDETIERIDFTIVQIVKKRLDQARSANEGNESAVRLFGIMKQRARRGDDPDNLYRAFALFTILRDPKWAQEEARTFRDGPPTEQVAPLSHREFDTLQAMLPPQDVKTLNQYVSDPWMQSLILRDWAVEAVRRKIRGRSKPSSLAEQYENMPTPLREVLDLLPPEQARKELIEGI